MWTKSIAPTMCHCQSVVPQRLMRNREVAQYSSTIVLSILSKVFSNLIFISCPSRCRLPLPSLETWITIALIISNSITTFRPERLSTSRIHTIVNGIVSTASVFIAYKLSTRVKVRCLTSCAGSWIKLALSDTEQIRD